ncbi:MAG: glutaredoxin 3, partial [Thermodesulfobacteriota bacterium]
MAKVMIYTTTYCPYCYAAKALLDSKGVKYKEIDVTKDPAIKRQVMEEIGWRTVPIILINDRLVGGFDDLRALDREKKLDELL